MNLNIQEDFKIYTSVPLRSSRSERVRSHEKRNERRNELKPVWDLISVKNLTSVFSQLFTYIHINWDEMKLKPAWISYWLFCPKWNFKPAWDFMWTEFMWNEMIKRKFIGYCI